MSEDYFGDEPAKEKAAATADDFFSSGSPSCRFNSIGDSHAGTIVSFEEAQQRDIKTGKPKFWLDGNPCQMLVVTLATSERDGEIDDDDGQRRLYVNKPGGMFAAIKIAMGKNKLAIGGTLAIKYVKDGEKKQAAYNAPKEYVARYIPPIGGPAPAVSTQQPASSTNGIWTWAVACQKAIDAGMTVDDFKDRLKLLGLKGYDVQHDTGKAQMAIKAFEGEKAATEAFESIPSATATAPGDDSIPF